MMNLGSSLSFSITLLLVSRKYLFMDSIINLVFFHMFELEVTDKVLCPSQF